MILILLTIFVCAFSTRVLPISPDQMYFGSPTGVTVDHVYLVKNVKEEGKFLIVDTAFKSQWSVIDAFFESNSHGIGYENISHIFLTHGHIDHASNVLNLLEKTNAILICSDYALQYVQEGINSDYATAQSDALNSVTLWAFLNLVTGMSYDVVPDQYSHKIIKLSDLEKGDVEFEEYNATIGWVPGHTNGSISLFLKDTKEYFVGDLLVGGVGAVQTLSWISSFKQLNDSIQHLREFDFDRVYCVHCDSDGYTKEEVLTSLEGKYWSDVPMLWFDHEPIIYEKSAELVWFMEMIVCSQNGSMEMIASIFDPKYMLMFQEFNFDIPSCGAYDFANETLRSDVCEESEAYLQENVELITTEENTTQINTLAKPTAPYSMLTSVCTKNRNVYSSFKRASGNCWNTKSNQTDPCLEIEYSREDSTITMKVSSFISSTMQKDFYLYSQLGEHTDVKVMKTFGEENIHAEIDNLYGVKGVIRFTIDASSSSEAPQEDYSLLQVKIVSSVSSSYVLSFSLLVFCISFFALL